MGVHCTEAAQAALNAGEALAFDWHRVGICCAAAGEISLRRDSHERLERSATFRPLTHDGETPVYAHRMAFPHLAQREVMIDCRRLVGFRHFVSDLPPDFGLRSSLGRLPG